jgi:hypothetical protein
MGLERGEKEEEDVSEGIPQKQQKTGPGQPWERKGTQADGGIQEVTKLARSKKFWVLRNEHS